MYYCLSLFIITYWSQHMTIDTASGGACKRPLSGALASAPCQGRLQAPLRAPLASGASGVRWDQYQYQYRYRYQNQYQNQTQKQYQYQNQYQYQYRYRYQCQHQYRYRYRLSIPPSSLIPPLRYLPLHCCFSIASQHCCFDIASERCCFNTAS